MSATNTAPLRSAGNKWKLQTLHTSEVLALSECCKHYTLENCLIRECCKHYPLRSAGNMWVLQILHHWENSLCNQFTVGKQMRKKVRSKKRKTAKGQILWGFHLLLVQDHKNKKVFVTNQTQRLLEIWNISYVTIVHTRSAKRNSELKKEASLKICKDC